MQRNSSMIELALLTGTKNAPKPKKSKTPRRYTWRNCPATADVDYDKEEVEFMMAVQRFKERTGLLFPTWSEILGILKTLGYQKVKTSARQHGERHERETRQLLDHGQLLGVE